MSAALKQPAQFPQWLLRWHKRLTRAAHARQQHHPRGISSMDDRFNTIAGWTLFSGIVALGLSSVSHHFYEADKDHRPQKMGYEIEGVVSSEGGAATEVPIETLLASADAAKGQATFAKCSSCHSINQGGANGIGPNLYGVVGEAQGKGRGGYAFSSSLAAMTGKWDFKSLDAWLKSPRAYVDGTKMSFAGLGNGQDRANVIVYLNAQGSNLPLPAAPAAADPAAAPAPGAPAGGAAIPGNALKGDASAAGAMAGAAPQVSGGGDKAVGSASQK